MMRILAIAAMMAALLGVVVTSAAYAVPLAAATPVRISASALCETPAELARPVALAGKFCIKRHSLGLPCAPQPLILPMAISFQPVPTPVGAAPAKPVLTMLPDGLRLFRPPRPASV